MTQQASPAALRERKFAESQARRAQERLQASQMGRLRAVIPALPPVVTAEYIARIARELMQLQKRRKLIAWCDAFAFYVARFEEVRPPGATRRRITLAAAQQIIEAGDLSPIYPD